MGVWFLNLTHFITFSATSTLQKARKEVMFMYCVHFIDELNKKKGGGE
jgi:hypothetical protein